MATTSSQGGRSPATTSGRKPATRRSTTRRSTTGRTTSGRSTASRRRTTRATTSSTQPRKPVEQVQQIAERALLVPVGASLVARDNLVTTVKEFATKYRTRTAIERELTRYKRRG